MTCDHCDQPATVHLTEMRGGVPVELHWCQGCSAASHGLDFDPPQRPAGQEHPEWPFVVKVAPGSKCLKVSAKGGRTLL